MRNAAARARRAGQEKPARTVLRQIELWGNPAGNVSTKETNGLNLLETEMIPLREALTVSYGRDGKPS